MQVNISTLEVFKLLGQPIRVQIILIIATGESCVCHMEEILGIRQATISQHMMVLRNSGLVNTKRIGRNIFYSLANPALYQAILQLGLVTGISMADLKQYAATPVEGCSCPICNPGIEPKLACKKIRRNDLKTL